LILLIDNYDSFTWNLVQRLGEIDPSVDLRVVRNDKITLEQIESDLPERIIISPGPCTPKEAGISCDVLAKFAGRMPIFGCLPWPPIDWPCFRRRGCPKLAGDAWEGEPDSPRRFRSIRGIVQPVRRHEVPQPRDQEGKLP